MPLVKENEELLPHHTIVLETEWEIGTHYRLDFPQKNQTEVIMTFFIRAEGLIPRRLRRNEGD